MGQDICCDRLVYARKSEGIPSDSPAAVDTKDELSPAKPPGKAHQNNGFELES